MGYYVIKHTDGNILASSTARGGESPRAALDRSPGRVDWRRSSGCTAAKSADRHVNCGLLQTGTDEQVIADARRALRQGMPGYGYVFSTSNCVYTGMALERYELMLRVLNEEGIYR